MVEYILMFIFHCAAVALLAIMFMAAGMVSGLKQLEYTKFVETIDGKEDVYVSLKLGPFTYTINIPEKKENSKQGSE